MPMSRPGKGKGRTITTDAKASPIISESIYAEAAKPASAAPATSVPVIAAKPPASSRTALLASLLLAGLALVAFPLNKTSPTTQLAGPTAAPQTVAAPTLAAREPAKSEITGSVESPRKAVRKRKWRRVHKRKPDAAAWYEQLFAPERRGNARTVAR
jgi:hypothetical protein